MKRTVEKFYKAAKWVLAAVLVLALVPFGVFTENDGRALSANAAFQRSAVCDGVTVSVLAGKNVFPADATLSVKKVSASAQRAVDAAVQNERDGDVNVAASYTFDIKMLDKNGGELQPAAGKKIQVHFDLPEAADANLDASVFHVTGAGSGNAALNADSLPVKTNRDSLSVETNGFSFYTVEFTYGDKTYVLDGEDVDLRDILNTVGLTGNIEKVEVSNEKLFGCYPSDGVYWIVSFEPFTSREYLKVTLDGIEYEITVTDDLKVANTTIPDIDGVEQGGSAADFTENMPLATLWIDEDKINTTVATRNSAESVLLTNIAGFNHHQNGIGYSGTNWCTFNFKEYTAAGNKLIKGDNYFAGDIVQYTFKAAAEDPYGKRLDIVVTYSDLHVILPTTITDYYLNNYIQGNGSGTMLGLCSANMVAVSANYGNGNNNQKFAIDVSVNIKIVDPDTGEIVPGTYYYPMVDLDIARGSGWGGGFPGNTDNRYYSEQVVLTGNYGTVFIPGADYSSTNSSTNAYRYKSGVEQTSEGLRIYGAGSDNNTFYSGFATLADNTAGGINFHWKGCGGYTFGSTSAGLETYLLYGSTKINHQLKATSGEGGTIYTTDKGNHTGDLTQGNILYNTEIIDTATGQTVIYTMTPKRGYTVKSVTVHHGSLDYTKGSGVTPVPVDTDGDGHPDYYTFRFSEIDSDNAIHVEWELEYFDLKISKTTVGNKQGSFDFTLDLWVEDPCETCGGTGDDGSGHCAACADTGVIKTPYDLDEPLPSGVSGGNGTYTFSVSNGNAMTLPHILSGTKYKVVEAGQTYWNLVDSSNTTGTLYKNTTAAFKNEKPEFDLTVRKTVNGNMGDRQKAFQFTVTAPALAGVTVNAVRTSGGKTTATTVTFDASGSIAFQLAHRESMAIQMPDGTGYTVSEQAVTGYAQSHKINDGATVRSTSTGQRTLNSDTDVEFINGLQISPPTGIFQNPTPAILILLTALASAAALLYGSLRKRRAAAED